MNVYKKHVIRKTAIKTAYNSKENLTLGKDVNGVFIWKQDQLSRLTYAVRILKRNFYDLSKTEMLNLLYVKFYKKPYSVLPDSIPHEDGF